VHHAGGHVIQLGPIVIPCRRCLAKPGDPCTFTPGAPNIYNDAFHPFRIRDAAAASALIAEPTPITANELHAQLDELDAIDGHDERDVIAEPRVFERLDQNPDSGVRFETCVACGKHVRHHYGSSYRCDPKPNCSSCDPSFACYDGATACSSQPDVPIDGVARTTFRPRGGQRE